VFKEYNQRIYTTEDLQFIYLPVAFVFSVNLYPTGRKDAYAPILT